MAHSGAHTVHAITATDPIDKHTSKSNTGEFVWLDLPGDIHMLFDGYGAESEANLLGFLDQMHTIRNALIQDMADRAVAS